MSPFHPGVLLALVITAHAYAGTSVPVPLTKSELKALCTIDASTLQICSGYVAGVSDELETTSKEAARTLGLPEAAALAPCPGKQMAELVISLLAELNASPNGLSDPALAAVEDTLHLPFGCHGSQPSSSITLFADGARLKAFCTGSNRNERLQCEGYIRAVADATLRVLNSPKVRLLKNCMPAWQTPDQAVSASIVYLNAHPEHEKVPAPTLVQAALLPPSCMLAPEYTAPDSPR
jgi:Rap1a immunity proteins